MTVLPLVSSEDDLQQAIYSAHLQDMIKELPQGLETMLGERGLTLSGGQRQRVAIARAMLRNAPIVILDEATSALDNESEAIVQKAMDNLMKDKEQYVLMSAQILACEDLLKTLGYEKEVIEDGWFYEKYKPYTDAMGALINIVTLYTSAKFGFEPGLGVDAHFGASGAMMNDEVKKALVDNYRVSYNKYNHIEEPQKKEA